MSDSGFLEKSVTKLKAAIPLIRERDHARLTHLIPTVIPLQMVFGWGKKKTEPEVPQAKDILLSDVRDVASKLLDLRKSQTISEIRSHRDYIMPLLHDLLEIKRALERDDLKIDDIDKNIRVIVVRGKKQVIDVIRNDIVNLPEVSTYDDAVSLRNVLNQLLKKIGDTLGRHTRVIHIFAKKYAAKLKDTLADINSENAEIQMLLENYEYSRSTFTEISDLLEQISNIKKFNANARQKISVSSTNLAACKDKIAACSESIKEIKSSERYAKLQRQKEELDQLALQNTQLNNKILDQFTKISRPLGRYEYVSSLDKEQKMLLAGLNQYPYKVLTKDNQDAIITILENVKKGILSGAVSVKDRTKSIRQITEVEESLDGMISEILEHSSKQDAVREAIGMLAPADLPVLEKDLEKATSDKSAMESKVQSLYGDMSANESKIPQIIDHMEAKLYQFSSIRYSIVTEN